MATKNRPPLRRGCISYEKMGDNCIVMLVYQRVSPWYCLRWLDCSSKQSSVRCAWMVKRRWVEKTRISMLHLIRLSRVWLSNWQRSFLFHEHAARFLPHVVKTTLIAKVSNGLMFDEFLEYFSFLFIFVIYDVQMMSFFSAINLKSMYLSLAAESLQVFVVGLYFPRSWARTVASPQHTCQYLGCQLSWSITKGVKPWET